MKKHQNKHITQQIDKGVHPSLGLHLLVHLPINHFHYMLKVSKLVLYNAQNEK